MHWILVLKTRMFLIFNKWFCSVPVTLLGRHNPCQAATQGSRAGALPEGPHPCQHQAGATHPAILWPVLHRRFGPPASPSSLACTSPESLARALLHRNRACREKGDHGTASMVLPCGEALGCGPGGLLRVQAWTESTPSLLRVDSQEIRVPIPDIARVQHESAMRSRHCTVMLQRHEYEQQRQAHTGRRARPFPRGPLCAPETGRTGRRVRGQCGQRKPSSGDGHGRESASEEAGTVRRCARPPCQHRARGSRAEHASDASTDGIPLDTSGDSSTESF